MSTTDQWYIGQRAEALTKVLLTRRNDLHMTALQEEDHGITYRVELRPQGHATGRIFGIHVQARIPALTDLTLLTIDLSVMSRTMLRSTFPVCLFFFTMEDNGAYFCWLIEPKITDEQIPKLIKPNKYELKRLTADEINQIIDQINGWYERLYQSLAR